MTVRHFLDVHPEEALATPGWGPIPAQYAFVGIAPSPNRPIKRINQPFGAKSWDVIRSIEAKVPGQIYYTNLVKEPVEPSTDPTKDQVRHYLPALVEELRFVKPKRVLALGAATANALCPGFKSMREDHGSLFFNADLGVTVMPTYHFSAIGRDPSLKPFWINDMQRFFTLKDPVPPDFLVSEHFPAEKIPSRSKVFLDIETTGLSYITDEIISVGMMVRNPEGIQSKVFIVLKPLASDIKQLLTTIKRRECTVIGHNLSFDLTFLSEKGHLHWDVPTEDTMLMAAVWGEEVLSLKHLTTLHTSRPGSRSMGGITDHGYLAEDVLSTAEIYDYFDHLLGPTRYARTLVNDLVPVITGMRRRGMYVDRGKLAEISAYYENQASTIEATLRSSARHLRQKVKGSQSDGLEYLDDDELINWRSVAQVTELFHEVGIKLTEKTKKGAYSLNEAVLVELATNHDLARKLLDYRLAEKMLSFVRGYLDMTYDVHPYIHPRLKLDGTRTGRLSCVEPNIQQVPRVGPLKLLFRSRWEGGKIGLIDLSQAELRVAGIICGDLTFAKMLVEGDAHRNVASMIFHKPKDEVTQHERKRAKIIVFGLLYGGGAKGLAMRLKPEFPDITEDDVKIVIDNIFEAFPGLKRWIKKVKDQSVRDLYIESPFGRRRDLRSIFEFEGESGVKRKGINTPIQGTASDIALVILRGTARRLRDAGLRSRPIMAIHDSNVLEIYPGEEEAVAQAVRDAFTEINDTPLSKLKLFEMLPLEGELIIGETWAHCESTNESYDPLAKYSCSSTGEVTQSSTH
jgi:DNA polymerase-1